MTSFDVLVREESPEDFGAIRALNDVAFGRAQEGALIDRLRDNGAAILSLVAVADRRVVGHLLLSPVMLERCGAPLEGAGLGPMAVLPEFQRRGVGGRLIVEGTRRLRAGGFPFIVVLGHAGYYPRFGFVPASRCGIRCPWEVPDEVFMILPLDRERVGVHPGVARYRAEFSMVS